MLKKKNFGKFSKNYLSFYQKMFTMLSNIWVWDPRSGIRDPGSGKNLFRIPESGVKKALDPGSGSATLVINCYMLKFFLFSSRIFSPSSNSTPLDTKCLQPSNS